jgi:DNA-binding transcriptional MerR regulator
MKIGELASRLGIAPSTIRYYEQIGLLKPPVRSANGYRRYSEESAVRIRQIQAASKLGIPLDAVRTLFAADGRSVKTRAAEQIALRLREIEATQAALQRQHQDLLDLLKNLDRAGCAAQDVCGGAGQR